ncbi:hypothetical protein K461DRAFT_313753 [Myriangium duriaei CBS 260.36]|uniref:Uncharacterized protein n=1 Tax=Myriangium duriaei CBS 260.36 TaxID=1168546 RepID=A0A9P4IY21_9PEZI|nr:hypothetical protein K461DRAFT_313753 [Myriangium duriaei CBS 260.36]
MSPNGKLKGHVDQREDVVPQVRHIKNRIATITWSFSIATLPILLLNAALIYLVFRFRVKVDTIPFPRLAYPFLVDGSAYYINLSPTFLIFVSSWASSAAPLCAGMLVTLGSFPICKAYLTKIKRGDESALPTPYQLSLIIRFFNGGSFNALWFWLLYCFGWRRRQGQSAPVKQVALITIMATLLGVAVFLADTWLHVSTKSVNVPMLASMGYPPSLSFGLAPQYTSARCSGAAGAHNCAFNFTPTSAFLRNSSTSLQVLHNTSSLATVSSYTDERGSFAYYSPPSDPSLSTIDYTASTYGIQTQCRPVSQQCFLIKNNNTDFSQWLFNCSSVLYHFEGPRGEVIMNYVGGLSVYFPNASLIQDEEATPNPITNPYNLGYAILYVNGSITRFYITNSNDSVANYFQAPMALTHVADASLQVNMEAATATSDTADQVAQKFAASYGKIALAIGSQVMQRNPTTVAQERSMQLLTKLETLPFYTLLIVNMIFVMAGVVLAALAVASVTDPTVNDLQHQLSVPGLVADRFEGSRARRGASHMELLFEESEGGKSGRVVILPSKEGGMEFKLRRSNMCSIG